MPRNAKLPHMGTCNDQTPCVNGACCSKVSGLCGYSPSECGAGNCSSNCDAKAECGQYGTPGNQKCPLGVCCSKFGSLTSASRFCGSTSEFCDDGCQKSFGGCGDVKRPSCSRNGGSVEGINIGYYESWANTRACSAVKPEDLNLNGFTHLNFAFVFFNPATFEIVPMDKNAGSLLHRFTKLKEKKPGLQTWVSVGGWSFNDPGPYQQAFSNMASTAANRKTFITNVIRFMDTYGFNGMDLDWEYPTADDRGGKAEDSANYVLLSKDIKDAFGSKYGYSITLPASYWYLQHFELAKHQDSVNWFNLMTYDLHGVWDAASRWIGPKIASHTNITEINLALDLLWRAGVKPEKAVLGKGYYGRSFTLTDASCSKPDGSCTFSGGGKEGRCSKASGILTLQEIQEIIKEKNLKPIHDQKAGVKWIHWDDDQWVSYDDQDTFKQKKEFANSRCLGGLMVWAIDQVDQKEKSLNYPDDWTEGDIADAEVLYQDEAAQGVCYTTMCNEKCAPGEHEASQMNGQPGDLSTMDRCVKGEFRRLCCAKGSIMGKCRWRGYRGLGIPCSGGCADGETEMTQNTNHHSDTEDQSCTGGTQSYCCAGFKPPITKEQVEDKMKDEAKELALETAEAAALEIVAKQLCRVAITAALTPLTFIPLVGWLVRLAIQAAVPALANLCAKGLAKAGKSIFKFQGKDYDVKVDKPQITKKDRGPSAKPTKPPGKTAKCSKRNTKLAKRLRPKKITQSVWLQPPDSVFVDKVCEYDRMSQACLHYSSVISRRPKLSSITCGDEKGVGQGDIREVKNDYYTSHHTDWITGWMRAAKVNCERDEFPPAAVWQGRDKNVWIRLSPRLGNSRAGQLFKKVCPNKVQTRTIQQATSDHDLPVCNGRVTEVWIETVRLVDRVFRLGFNAIPNDLDDQGLTMNPCWPEALVDDPGFALLFGDPWYARQANQARQQNTPFYPNPPSPQRIGSNTPKAGWNKRDFSPKSPTDEWNRPDLSPEDIYIDQGNSSRKPTDEELEKEFGLLRCQGDYSTTTFTVTVTAAPLNPVPTTMSTFSHIATQALSAAQSLITESVQYAFHGEEEYEDENEEEYGQQEIDWDHVLTSGEPWSCTSSSSDT
ncbi:glycoside hydrolase family 18 protein [Dothidotthia symphoricarpi CBS 119687]|uniref:chitinase n=1 Tax=Dothidotthia symphoricarpi CBS 119687 TaxID=1392245 RepID=A0A6A6AGF5_9PLEO|nr:glycoside hydrolase family 18 protein [Dothidotthia symphoricarpi CBS 119687]KAF2130205.1 glycoside hydrolase family 18 protein [Dothidotthia symphoricarpi CBS 119687]